MRNKIEWEQSVGYMKPHLEALRDQGIKIDSLLDIGAAKGHFSLMFDEVFEPKSITLVEANKESSEYLFNEYPYWISINTAIGKNGKATFYINPNEPTGGGSSLFRENTEWFEFPEKEEVDVVTLDSLGIQADFIKMDIQGGEYDAIKHGKDTVQKAKFLLLELSFIQYNKDAPLIDDVLSLTRECGFRMIDTFGVVSGGHWYKGRKCQVDVLLAREDQPVFMI